MVAPACASLSNEAMRIDICGMDDAIASLVLDGDEAGMNWVVGRRRWGLVRAYAPHSSPRRSWDFADTHYLPFKGVSRDGDAIVSSYSGDGSASCAYYVPLSMSLTDGAGEDIGSAVRGERFDPWATDQDFGLYFILKEL